MTAVTQEKPTIEIREKNFYTPEEYLALEENAECKHEYRNGKIIAMTGGTTNHNEITGNFYANAKFALKKQNYRIFISDVRLWIEEYRQYTYPDVMIIEGKPIYHGKGTSTVTNPTVIVEVLSPSTQDYDRGTKFTYYRAIPELKEYILINQSEYAVEQFSKNEEGKWVLTEEKRESALLKLPTLNYSIALAEIYDNINFNISQD